MLGMMQGDGCVRVVCRQRAEMKIYQRAVLGITIYTTELKVSG